MGIALLSATRPQALHGVDLLIQRARPQLPARCIGRVLWRARLAHSVYVSRWIYGSTTQSVSQLGPLIATPAKRQPPGHKSSQTSASAPKQIIDRPDILEELKVFLANPDKTLLPEGWSRHFSDLSKEKAPEDTDIIAAVFNIVDSDTLPNVFHTHHSTWPLPYHYPLPTQHAHKLKKVPTHATLLSCTTRKAALVVQDIHRYYDTLLIARISPDKPIPFIDTLSAIQLMELIDEKRIAKSDFIPDFCSVATLETKDGSWAGVLRLIDDQTHISPGMEIQTISISTGSTTNKEAGRSYEEQIDRIGCWGNAIEQIEGMGCGANAIKHHHFSSMASGEKGDQKSEYSPFKGEPRDRGPLFYLYGGFCPQQTEPREAIKVFFQEEEPLTGKNQERYEFHNVLWVETRDGIMYRKAAGRVPKEIWEKNCGEPEQTVLS